ncbi:MAG: nucleotidyltransferase family protein [Cyclobacteriaceae bacterium]|nr:nucleotidyltransferase family protein [Cyclobacteriaceae bacterium]
MDEKIAIIILGAGASTRLNQPKQLLEYKGKTLIENAVNTALDSNFGPVYVVLGSNGREIVQKLKSYREKIKVIQNSKWEEGVSSSIRAALKEIEKDEPEIYGIIITLVDQPLINVSHLIKMIKSHFTFGKKIIASGYGGSFGVPAFFHRNVFPYVEKLEGDQGAKSLISKLKLDVHIIPNADAEIDIDSEEDYKNLLKTT